MLLNIIRLAIRRYSSHTAKPLFIHLPPYNIFFPVRHELLLPMTGLRTFVCCLWQTPGGFLTGNEPSLNFRRLSSCHSHVNMSVFHYLAFFKLGWTTGKHQGWLSQSSSLRTMAYMLSTSLSLFFKDKH
jgi:hypothetical protein